MDDLKPGRMVDAVVALVREHPVPLLAPLVLFGILAGGGGPDYGEGRGPFDATPALLGLASLLLFALLVLAGALAWMVTVRAALDARATGRADLGAALRGVTERYWRGLGTLVVWGVAVGLGFFALVAPGVFLLVAWFPLVAVLVAEDATGLDALRRAWALTDGHRFDLLLVVALLVGAGVVAVVLVGWLPIVGPTLAGAVGGAASAVGAVAVAAWYDARVKR